MSQSNQPMASHLIRFLGLLAFCVVLPVPSLGATHVFNLTTTLPGTDGLGYCENRVLSSTIHPFCFGLTVGWNGGQYSRSTLDFNISRVPDTFVVTGATLRMTPARGFVYPFESIGDIRHLDYRTPPSPNPPPFADPRRFTWDSLVEAPIVRPIGSNLQTNNFDVGRQVAADHMAGSNSSPFALTEPPRTSPYIGQSYLYYGDSAQLIVESRPAAPVRYEILSLGGGRYRARYDLLNEISIPLSLIDIEFDTQLYDESSLSVTLSGDAVGWSAQVLNSAPGGVPAVVSLGSGHALAGGQSAAGFSVDFIWLGSGSPGAQSYTAFDPMTFATLYSGQTVATVVPWPPTLLLMAAGLLVLGKRLHSRSAVRSSATAIVLSGLVALAHATPALEVSSYELVSTRRIDATVYEYSYRVNAVNQGSGAADVEAIAISMRGWITPVVASAYFGTLPTGQTVRSQSTITIRHDRRFQFKPSDIEWRFTFVDSSFTGRFEGPPNATIQSQIVDYVERPPYSRSAIEITSVGKVLRTDLTVRLTEAATVGVLQPVLDLIGARVLGTLIGRTVILIRFPDPGSLSGLELIRQRLLSTTGVAAVDLAVQGEHTALPENGVFQPPSGSNTPPPSAISNYLAHHVAIRGYAGWNLRSKIEPDPPTSSMVTLPILMIIDNFGNGVPGSAFAVNSNDIPTNAQSDFHGYRMAGIAAATFGGVPPPGTDRPVDVVTGIIPLKTSKIQLIAIDYSQVSEKNALMATALRALQIDRHVVLNTSFALIIANGNRPSIDAEKCEAFKSAEFWVNVVRGGSKAFPGPNLERKILHLTSAGNNPKERAENVSHFALARMQTFKDDWCPKPRSQIIYRGLDNIIVVEGRFAESIEDDINDDVTGVGCPNGSFFNLGGGYFSAGGDVSAIGNVSRGYLFSPQLGQYSLYEPGIFSAYSPNTLTERIDGSSPATAQVAGLAAFAWALRPTMTVAQLKEVILSTTSRNQAGPTSFPPTSPPDEGCPNPYNPPIPYQAPIDAYAALLATDSPTKNLQITGPSDAPARLALLDIVKSSNNTLVMEPGDGFTQADIAAFLREFERRKGKVDYSRFDLNGDAHTGEAYFFEGKVVIERRRFDLNGDGQWARALQSIEGIQIPMDEQLGADISVLIYYAYSPLYTGNEYERTMLLLPYLRVMNLPAEYLTGLRALVSSPSITLNLSQFQDQANSFVSVGPDCAFNGERGDFSAQVYSNLKSYGVEAPTFWQPRSVSSPITPTNFKPTWKGARRFVATIKSSGRVWINAVARRTTTNPISSDVEYQTRLYLGDLDLEAGSSDGRFEPSPRRASTQWLSYGVVPFPAAPFAEISRSPFRLESMRFQSLERPVPDVVSRKLVAPRVRSLSPNSARSIAIEAPPPGLR